MIREKPLVAKTTIPKVFQEIIKNDNRCAEILALGSEMTKIDWRELAVLKEDKKKNLRPGAEQALKWNVDKGAR